MTNIIPKAELHCHIEGAAPVELAKKQAEKYGINIDNIIDGEHYKWHDFTSFITAYDTVANLFRTEDDYHKLAYEYLASIARDGALYSEIFISPDHAMEAGLSAQAYIDGLAAGIDAAQSEFGIISRMIIVGVRHLGADKVEKAAQIAASRPHPYITGFGMAGDERSGRVADFTRAFDIARDAGLGITVHAGELVGAQSVQDAIDHLSPSRIGHGVRAIEDADLVKRIADKQIVLEVCPCSNIALSVFESMKQHPFKQLVDAGIQTTISSDDPPFFATNLANDYTQIANTFNYSDTEMLKFTQNAIEAAFVDNETKTKILTQLSAE
ncbi:MAG: adenosine deaminase [Lentilitoribacter sp.]